MSVLTTRDCEIIGFLVEGHSLTSACDCAGVNDSYDARASVRVRILRCLGLDDITQIRLWASPISDKELDRLCGRVKKAAAVAA